MESFFEAVVYFFLFSFCGWLCETVYCSIKAKKFVNRGFLSGPICPVYGFGGLIVVYLLAPLQGNIPLLFLWGMVATTTLEYITSFVLEKLFHTSWWDYSHLPFNIHGRVCLSFALVFGGLSVVAVKVLYPPFSSIVESIPAIGKAVIASVGMALITGDAAVTVRSILALNGKLDELRQVSAELKAKWEESKEHSSHTLNQWLEKLQADQAERTESWRESLLQSKAQMEMLKESTAARFQNRRLMNAFPNMKSIKRPEQLAELKQAIHALKEKTKEIGKKK